MTEQLEEIKRTFVENNINQLLGLKEKLINVDRINSETEIREIAEEVFTVMHGMAGTAPMLGIEAVEPMSRKLELVFDKIRKGEKDFSEQLSLQAVRGIDGLIEELKCNSEKIAL